MLAPLALLQQWKNELEEKVEKDYVSVLIYHGEVACNVTIRGLWLLMRFMPGNRPGPSAVQGQAPEEI